MKSVRIPSIGAITTKNRQISTQESSTSITRNIFNQPQQPQVPKTMVRQSGSQSHRILSKASTDFSLPDLKQKKGIDCTPTSRSSALEKILIRRNEKTRASMNIPAPSKETLFITQPSEIDYT